MKTKTTTKHPVAITLLAAVAVSIIAPDVFAQVNATAVTDSVKDKASIVYEVIRAVGVIGGSISALMLAYKALFSKQFDLIQDGKGLAIGAVIFGAAGLIGNFFA